MAEDRRLLAILFSDIVGYSAMVGRDEETTLRVVTEHRALVREVVAARDGREHRTTGDGFLVLFASQATSEIEKLSFWQRHAEVLYRHGRRRGSRELYGYAVQVSGARAGGQPRGQGGPGGPGPAGGRPRPGRPVGVGAAPRPAAGAVRPPRPKEPARPARGRGPARRGALRRRARPARGQRVRRRRGPPAGGADPRAGRPPRPGAGGLGGDRPAREPVDPVPAGGPASPPRPPSRWATSTAREEVRAARAVWPTPDEDLVLAQRLRAVEAALPP